MKRKVYLQGEIAERYGSEFEFYVDSFSDTFRLLQANFPDFKKFLIECEEKNIGFTLQRGEEFINDEDDLLVPLKDEDLIIAAVPVGSKSGMGKIFAALAIAVLFVIPGAQGAGLMGIQSAGAVKIASGVAINLALAGIQQLMAPDPSVDKEEPQSYMFNGTQQNIVEGDPVPLLYGELRVPGRMIGMGAIVAARGISGVTGPTTHRQISNGAGTISWEIE